jgi:hypothetical protein
MKNYSKKTKITTLIIVLTALILAYLFINSFQIENAVNKFNISYSEFYGEDVCLRDVPRAIISNVDIVNYDFMLDYELKAGKETFELNDGSHVSITDTGCDSIDLIFVINMSTGTVFPNSREDVYENLYGIYLEIERSSEFLKVHSPSKILRAVLDQGEFPDYNVPIYSNCLSLDYCLTRETIDRTVSPVSLEVSDPVKLEDHTTYSARFSIGL